MPFVTSDVASKVNAEPIDAIKTMQGFAELQNALNQNKMFQAKSLAGEYLAQSTGPDGLPDFNQFSQSLKEDNRTAPMAAELLQNAQTIRNTGVAGQQATKDLSQSQYDAFRNIVSTAGNVSQASDLNQRIAENSKSAATAAAKGVEAGLFPAALVASAMGNGDMSSIIRAATIAGSGGTGAQTAMTGTPVQTNLGGKVVSSLVNQYTGSMTPMSGGAAELPVSLSPSDKLTRIPYTEQDTGLNKTIAQGALVDSYGNPTAVPGVTGPSGELTTGLAPGEADAIAIPKRDAAEQVGDLQRAYGSSNQRESLLKELLAVQGDFRSGPGAAKWSGFVTEANRVLGTDFSPTDTPSQQVFSKIAEQLAVQQRNAFGSAPTNTQTELARLMSPNDVNSPVANQQVAALLLGNEKYIQKKHEAYQKYLRKGGKPSNYMSFQAQFNPVFDPRYFQEEYMTKDQKDQMYRGMDAAERERYTAGRKRALSVDFSK